MQLTRLIAFIMASSSLQTSASSWETHRHSKSACSTHHTHCNTANKEKFSPDITASDSEWRAGQSGGRNKSIVRGAAAGGRRVAAAHSGWHLCLWAPAVLCTVVTTLLILSSQGQGDWSREISKKITAMAAADQDAATVSGIACAPPQVVVSYSTAKVWRAVQRA